MCMCIFWGRTGRPNVTTIALNFYHSPKDYHWPLQGNCADLRKPMTPYEKSSKELRPSPKMMIKYVYTHIYIYIRV